MPIVIKLRFVTERGAASGEAGRRRAEALSHLEAEAGSTAAAAEAAEVEEAEEAEEAGPAGAEEERRRAQWRRAGGAEGSGGGRGAGGRGSVRAEPHRLVSGSSAAQTQPRVSCRHGRAGRACGGARCGGAEVRGCGARLSEVQRLLLAGEAAQLCTAGGLAASDG